MKTTDHFKRVIERYLVQRAKTDELFAVSFNNPEINLDDCVTYILNTVKQSGCCGFSDEEIYSMATHYFDEPTIEVGNPINCKVIVNEHIELTAEEKEQARQNAIQRAENEIYERMTKARKRPNVQPEPAVQKSLFDQ